MPRKPDLSIVGKTYNNLTVVSLSDERANNGRALYLCRCLICGGNRLAERNDIIRGKIKDCGCKKHLPKNNLVGRTFGRLTVTGTTVKNDKLYYICLCACGNTTTVLPQGLINQNTTSCGCKKREAFPRLVVDGTMPSKLQSKKLRITNTSGVTGVYWDKSRNLWSASIIFKHKKYFLGRFADKADAIKARADAEGRIFGTFLEWYDTYTKNQNLDIP